MKEFYPLLQNCALFDGIALEDLRTMLGCLGGKKISAMKGQYLFQEGDAVGFVGIVLTGRLQLIRQDYYGNRSIMGCVEPGDLFGESYAFSGIQELPVTVYADADSQILLLDSTRIYTCCGNACHFHNQLISNLLKVVANKNLLLHQKLQVTSQRTTREKLMTYLLHQAKQQKSRSFRIPFDRQALADYLEVDRSGLSAEISKLRKEGILESEKNSFRLL